AAEKIQARVACNIPQVRLIRHKKNLVLRNALLKGDFTVDAQKLSWDINSIKIDSMDLDLDSEGTLIFGSQSSPAALELKAAGWHINVAAVARSFKKLAGDLAWVQSAFSVAREGVLTKTTCRLVARQTGSGWIVPEIQATGRLDRGLISIPGADLDLADLSGDVILENQRVDFKLMQGRLPYGIFEQLDARIDWQQAAILQVSAPRATVRLEEFYPWLVTFENLQELRQYVSAATGELAFTQLEIDGPLTLPADWQMAMAATVRDVTISVPDISGPLHLSQGVVGLKQKALVFEKVRVQYLDADTVTSGKIQGKPGQLELLRLLLDGALGEQAIAGFHRLMALPEYLRVQPALQIAKMDLQWDARDSATVVGEITAGGGTRLSIDAAWAPERWQIHRFELKDVFSSISLRLTRSGARVDLDYSGKLHKATLDHFLKENNTLKGWVDGKLMASGDMNDLRSLQVTGVLRGEGLSLQPWVLSPIAVERFALDCRGKSARLESADLIVAGTPMRLKGTAGMEARAYIFDLDLAVDSLNAAALNKIRDEVTSRAKKPETDEKKLLPVSGVIRLKTPRFTFKEYTLSPLHADIAIRSDTVEAVVTRAELCGISTPGTITIKPEGLQVSFKPTAVEKDLQATWECLQTRPLRADSRYSLSGIIETSGPAADLVRNLRGDLAFASDDGLIHRSNILTKIFSLLNITEIFAGKTSGLGENGFGYNAIRAHATVKAGALNFDQILVDGHAMKISGEGTVNLVEEKMAVNLLVAPLKMFDRLIKRIPVVGYITGGSVLSVPVKVKGATADPQVGLVPPAAVGRGLVGILERILKAPLEVVTSLPGVNGLKTPPTAPEAGKSGSASD
ncbi:MAG: hypothetical protein GY697_05685, partial [Desulfobacterales bacterium]|nr:hypothetical protein [Desulfobacterales bacterium]